MADVQLTGVDRFGDRRQVAITGSQLRVIADMESEFKHESEGNSLSFTWNTVSADYAAADTMLIVQNTSPTLKLHIENVWFYTDNASEFDIHTINDATTPAGGTAVTGVCLNRAAPKIAEAAAHSDDTANSAQGNIIWTGTILASTTYTVNYGGAVILGTNDAIAIDVTSAPGSLATAGISGYYKET
jgi:hypothetical protein